MTAPAEVTRWLRAASVPLTSVEAGAPAGDLRRFCAALDGVRVVGLGEATHGTREFFLLKHRLLEHLVTEHGFTVFAMEASVSAAPAVDAYVRYGTGDAARAVAGLGFWTWRTHEVLDLVEWLRTHNQGRPEAERVRFAGIDPQVSGPSLAAVEGFLLGTAPERVPEARDALGVVARSAPGAHPELRDTALPAAEALASFVRERAPGADVENHAEVLVRAADLVTRPRSHADPDRTVYAARDGYMADAVGELLAEPEAKVVVWAHNGHVGACPMPGGVRSMGAHLRERYGSGYYALGLLHGRGAFRAYRVLPGPWPGRRSRTAVPNRLGPPAPTTLEAALAAATPADHLLDLRSARTAPEAVRAWLRDSHLTREHGSQVPRWLYPTHHTPCVPAERHDGLAYLAVTTPSRPFPAAD